MERDEPLGKGRQSVHVMWERRGGNDGAIGETAPPPEAGKIIWPF